MVPLIWSILYRYYIWFLIESSLHESSYHSSKHTKLLVKLTGFYNRFHDLIIWFLYRNLTSRIALGWRIRMTNHLLQYYLKRNAFYKVSYSPIEYSPGLLLHYMCLCFFPLLFVLFHDMHTVIYTSCINLDEQAFDTGIEFWLSANYVWLFMCF